MTPAVAAQQIRWDYGIDKTPRQQRTERNAQASADATRKNFTRVERWAERVKQG